MIKNSKAWCFVKQTTRQSLPWSIYCFSMKGKRQRKRKSRPQRVVGEGMGTAHWFPWHQLNVQCNNSLDCYFPSGRIDLCHLKSVFNIELFLLQRLKCCFVKPSGWSLTSDIFVSIRKTRKAAGRNWWEAIPGHRSGPRKLHSCGHRPRFSKISRSTDRIASWAILRWESVSRWHDHGHATTESQFSAVFHHHSQPAIRAGYSIPACSWKLLAFPQHWKQDYGGERERIFWEKTFWSSSTPTGPHQDRAEAAEPLDTELADFEEIEVKGILVSTWQAWKYPLFVPICRNNAPL